MTVREWFRTMRAYAWEHDKSFVDLQSLVDRALVSDIPDRPVINLRPYHISICGYEEHVIRVKLDAIQDQYDAAFRESYRRTFGG